MSNGEIKSANDIFYTVDLENGQAGIWDFRVTSFFAEWYFFSSRTQFRRRETRKTDDVRNIISVRYY